MTGDRLPGIENLATESSWEGCYLCPKPEGISVQLSKRRTNSAEQQSCRTGG